MINAYTIAGSPAEGYSKRCPHNLTETKPVQLSTTRQRYRYGPDRPTIQRPLFVGSEGCRNCRYNIGAFRALSVPASLLLCSFPVRAWDLPAADLEGLQLGG